MSPSYGRPPHRRSMTSSNRAATKTFATGTRARVTSTGSASSWFLPPQSAARASKLKVPGQRELAQEVLDLARAEHKPVMIAESTPQGYDLKALTRANISPVWDGPAHGDLVQRTPEQIWLEWYVPLFSFIDANRDLIGAFAYINAHWDSQPMWAKPYASGYWGDSRIQANPSLQKLWLAEVSKPEWLHGGPQLFGTLNPPGSPMNRHDTTARDAHRRTITLAIVVALGGFLFGLDASVISGVVGFITPEFDLNEWQVGLVVGAPTLAGIASSIGSGLLSDLVGRKRVLIVLGVAVHAVLGGSRHCAELRNAGGRALRRRPRIRLARHCPDVHRGNCARGQARPDGVFQPVQHHGRFLRRVLRQLLSAGCESERSGLGAGAGYRSPRLALDAGTERCTRSDMAVAADGYSGKPALADRQGTYQRRARRAGTHPHARPGRSRTRRDSQQHHGSRGLVVVAMQSVAEAGTAVAARDRPDHWHCAAGDWHQRGVFLCAEHFRADRCRHECGVRAGNDDRHHQPHLHRDRHGVDRSSRPQAAADDRPGGCHRQHVAVRLRIQTGELPVDQRIVDHAQRGNRSAEARAHPGCRVSRRPGVQGGGRQCHRRRAS